MKYEVRTVQKVLQPEGEDNFGDDRCTWVRIENDGGGEFIEVEQVCGKIRISPEEWPQLKQLIDEMVADCRD